jgi:hypothetical protein
MLDSRAEALVEAVLVGGAPFQGKWNTPNPAFVAALVS